MRGNDGREDERGFRVPREPDKGVSEGATAT